MIRTRCLDVGVTEEGLSGQVYTCTAAVSSLGRYTGFGSFTQSREHSYGKRKRIRHCERFWLNMFCYEPYLGSYRPAGIRKDFN